MTLIWEEQAGKVTGKPTFIAHGDNDYLFTVVPHSDGLFTSLIQNETGEFLNFSEHTSAESAKLAIEGVAPALAQVHALRQALAGVQG